MRHRRDKLDSDSEQERAGRAAASLSALEREVLTLSAGLGLDNAEIARRLGIRIARAERVLARAIRKFDRALDAERAGRP